MTAFPAKVVLRETPSRSSRFAAVRFGQREGSRLMVEQVCEGGTPYPVQLTTLGPVQFGRVLHVGSPLRPTEMNLPATPHASAAA
jgi:hypothetical protein